MFTAGPARGTGTASTGNEHQNPQGLGDEGRHPMIPCTPFHAPHPLGFLSPPNVLGSLSPHPSCPAAWRACLPSLLPGIFHGLGQPQLLPEASWDRTAGARQSWQTSHTSSRTQLDYNSQTSLQLGRIT